MIHYSSLILPSHKRFDERTTHLVTTMQPPQLYASSLSSAANTKKRRTYPESEILNLTAEADELLRTLDEDQSSRQQDALLSQARELSTRAGLSVDSDLPSLLRNSVTSEFMTAGHSNTDHRIVWTDDYATDRTAELRRNLLSRNRYQCPETKGDDRWDKPRVTGERRRRIVREKDLPGAPPREYIENMEYCRLSLPSLTQAILSLVPPPTGYVVFLGQMTTKWRHDRQGKRHDQSRVVQEISKLWRIALSDEDHRYYNDFCEEIREEYKHQHMEFRATGVYTISDVFDRPTGAGLWVRKIMSEKNDLEKEIESFETINFPPRPPEFDEDYKKKEIESRRVRKVKLQKEWEEKRKLREAIALKNGLQPPKRRRKKKKKTGEEVVGDEVDKSSVTSGEAGDKNNSETAAASGEVGDDNHSETNRTGGEMDGESDTSEVG
jgi:hypothetical protein